jgi:hypothetical protein
MQRMRSLSKSKNTSPKNTAEKRVISSLRRSICAGRILSQQRYITCSLRHIRGLSPGCVTQQLISRKLRHQNALGVMWGRHDNFILSAQHARVNKPKSNRAILQYQGAFTVFISSNSTPSKSFIPTHQIHQPWLAASTHETPLSSQWSP